MNYAEISKKIIRRSKVIITSDLLSNQELEQLTIDDIDEISRLIAFHDIKLSFEINRYYYEKSSWSIDNLLIAVKKKINTIDQVCNEAEQNKENIRILNSAYSELRSVKTRYVKDVCKYVFDLKRYAQTLVKVNLIEFPNFEKMDYDIFDYAFSCRRSNNHEDQIFFSIEDLLQFLNQVRGYCVCGGDIEKWRIRMTDSNPWVTAEIETEKTKIKIKSNNVNAFYFKGLSLDFKGEIGISFSKEAFSAYLEFDAI